MNRPVASAARRLADQTSNRLTALDNGRHFRGVVTTVVPGGASDGNALAKVTWRGTELDASGYPDSYTPVVGHRVFCVIADAQLEILHHSVGSP